MATFVGILEETSRIYTATLKDESGDVIPSANLSTLTLTLYSFHSGAIINARDGQNVLNANNVTIHATSGLLTWQMQPEDNVILHDDNYYEVHRALFQWTLTDGKQGKHQVDFHVNNLEKVSA